MNLIFTADASGNPADPFVESDLQLAMGCAPDVDEEIATVERVARDYPDGPL